MINKEKFKLFLINSEYTSDIKIFVINVIKYVYNNPKKNANLIYLFDLDILIEDNTPSDDYYIIDFDYLQSLNSDIRDNFLSVLDSFICSDDVNFSFHSSILNLLFDCGIILNNIEYLKKKRKIKLEKINTLET